MASYYNLKLSRDQLAMFLKDHEQVKQFEKVFEALSSIPTEIVATLSAGTTGLTPATPASGDVVLDGTLNVANGGTGATDAASARTNLGAAASGDNSDITSLSGITGSIRTVDSMTFDTAAGVAVAPGQMAWNSGDGTIDVGMGYDGVVQQVGLETFYRIKADAAIANGDLVMFTGAVGASGVIKGAPSATGLAEGLRIMGVATMDIALNGFGYITNFGLVRGINTTGSSVGETWADGDILYYNPAYVGRMTKVRPASPNEVVIVAAVVNAGPGGSGSLMVRVSFYPRLYELSDVYALGAVDGDLIHYNNSTARWENVSPLSVLSSATGAPVTKTANFSVAANENWLINNKSGSSCTVTLPTASSYPGRVLNFQNYQAQTLVSASSNVVPLAGGSAGTAILQAVAGANATLVSDGTNWLITKYDSNNSLEME